VTLILYGQNNMRADMYSRNSPTLSLTSHSLAKVKWHIAAYCNEKTCFSLKGKDQA